jgi:hypothetical protein
VSRVTLKSAADAGVERGGRLKTVAQPRDTTKAAWGRQSQACRRGTPSEASQLRSTLQYIGLSAQRVRSCVACRTQCGGTVDSPLRYPAPLVWRMSRSSEAGNDGRLNNGPYGPSTTRRRIDGRCRRGNGWDAVLGGRLSSLAAGTTRNLCLSHTILTWWFLAHWQGPVRCQRRANVIHIPGCADTRDTSSNLKSREFRTSPAAINLFKATLSGCR